MSYSMVIEKGRIAPAAELPILDVRGMSKEFPVRGSSGTEVVRALQDVHLQVRKGETVAVVGESGCGKTTLLRCIMGLTEPTAGTVSFAADSITGLNRRAWQPYRRRIQMVFQKPFASLNRRRTVGEIVEMPLAVHRIGDRATRARRVEETLDSVGLGAAFRNRYPHELSGGQQQRVAIARALVLEPEVIVADEPVSALDVSVQSKIINLLLDLQEQRGLSYLVISHDLGVVERMADRILVMYLGRVVEEGPAHEVLHNPKHPYTRALVSSTPRIGVRASAVAPLSGEIPSPLAPPPGCTFHPRCRSFIGEVCRAKVPGVTPLPNDVSVRCHLYAGEPQGATQ
jgi:oligopeptide/dipeptide ABC transporter ATP-binding protein